MSHQGTCGRHQPDERADRQEGELAADVEQIHRVDARVSSRAASDSVLAGRASALRDRGRAERHRHDGRAHDGRGRSDEQGVAEHRQADDHISCPARQADHAKDEQECDGKRLQLEPGDGEQVGRAGSSERIVDLGIDLFAPAQKQGGGQRSG